MTALFDCFSCKVAKSTPLDLGATTVQSIADLARIRHVCYYGTDKSYFISGKYRYSGICHCALGSHNNVDSTTSISCQVTCSIAPCSSAFLRSRHTAVQQPTAAMLSLQRQHLTCTPSQRRVLHSSSPAPICSRHTRQHRTSRSHGHALQSGTCAACTA